MNHVDLFITHQRRQMQPWKR